MNAEVTFRDEQGDHKVKLMGIENFGPVVYGYQRVRSSFVKRGIRGIDVIAIKETPKTKLRELMKLTPVRVMFFNGKIETFDSIEVDPRNKKHLVCVTKPEDDDDAPEKQYFEASCPVTVIFE